MRRAILVFLLCAVPAAFGQSNYSVITGTLTDAQKSPVAGSSVVLTAKETRAERRVTSNAQGIFQITGLLPGDYELVVQAQGFAQVTRALRLEVGEQLVIDFALRLASSTSSVQVDASAGEVLHTVDASVGEVIEPAAVSNLPLNGRMLIDLVHREP